MKIEVNLSDNALSQIKEKLNQGMAIEEIMKEIKLNFGSI